MDIRDTEKYQAYIKSDKWKAIAKKRMEIDGHRCQGCGSRGTMLNPLECHHLSYKHLYHEENWIYQDLVTACHACHKTTHNIMYRITNEQGRRGWKDNGSIPLISVYTVAGETLENMEVGRI